MQFESIHTNPTIRSQSLYLEESKGIQIITQFTDKEEFTFRDTLRKPTSSGSRRYTSKAFDDLEQVEIEVRENVSKKDNSTENAKSVKEV